MPGERSTPICNLYRLTTPTDAIAGLFGAQSGPAPNVAEEIYPGYPGLVVAGGQIRSMTWGFPRAMKSKRTGLPIKPRTVNNAREDKLATPFWRDSFVNRRCLIPVSAWAEAQGEEGRMTRTWYAVPGDEPFAVAGIWRPTSEWGDAYSMVMVDNCAFMAEVHDRMPTILHRDAWDAWLHGTPEEAFTLCRIWGGPLIVDATPRTLGQTPATHSLLSNIPVRLKMIRLAFAAAFVGCFLSQMAQAQDFNGIARAIDGDSLRVGNREVRLFGIDAPEYRQTCKVRFTSWSCGGDAASALRTLVDGHQLTCQTRDRDVYGRTVATCRSGGFDVAAEMVSRGLAIVLAGAPGDYAQRQADSKAAEAGIWASEFVTPSEYRAAHPRSGSDSSFSPPRTTRQSRPASPAPSADMWRSCAQARAAGAAPVYRGEPGYNPMLDGDNDGIACEPYRKRR